MESFRAVLALWPSLRAVAEDTGARIDAVRKWDQRDSVPVEFWPDLQFAAKKRGIRGVTWAALHALKAKRNGKQAAEAAA